MNEYTSENVTKQINILTNVYIKERGKKLIRKTNNCKLLEEA